MVSTFICPVCEKKVRQTEPGEPCCTGPSETRHDHEITVMWLHKIDIPKQSELGFLAPSAYAEARAEAPLIFLDTDPRVKAAVKLILPG